MNFLDAVKFALREQTGFSGIVLHAASREMNVDLQGKSRNGKDEK